MTDFQVERDAEICALTSGDWRRLDGLFQRVFQQPLEASLADYRYAPGRGQSLGLVAADGALIAHCGITFRRWLAAGTVIQGAQLGDLMVAPEARDVLSRKRMPFYRVMEAALRRLAAIDASHWAYGFPSDRAMRIGQHLGLFLEIDQFHEITWPVSASPPRAHEQKTWTPGLAATIDRLWRRMAADLKQALVGVRDAAYFKNRYFDHPANDYRIFVLRRWWGPAHAVIVLRHHGEQVELMDWVAPISGASRVIDQARRLAAQLGSRQLFMWSGRDGVPHLSKDSSSCQPTQFRVPACGLGGAQQPWVTGFKDRLWLTSGDTDYR